MSSPEGSPPPAAALCAHQPTDVTLIKEILRPWVISGVSQPGGGVNVHVGDFYSADPEALVGRFAATVSTNGDKAWYFLTEVRAQRRGTRKIRSVLEGDGWWQGEAAAKDILDDVGNRPIGSRKSFSFMRKTANGEEVRLGWLMLEYYLHQHHDGDGPAQRIDSKVLAKLYRSKIKKRRVPDDEAEAKAAAKNLEAANPANGAGAATAAKNPEAANRASGAGGNKVAKNPEAASPASGAGAATAAKNPEASGAGAATAGKNPEASGAGTATAAENPEDAPGPARKKFASAAGKIAEAAKKLADAKGKVAGAPAAPAQLLCPRCGYHIGALQVPAPALG